MFVSKLTFLVVFHSLAVMNYAMPSKGVSTPAYLSPPGVTPQQNDLKASLQMKIRGTTLILDFDEVSERLRYHPDIANFLDYTLNAIASKPPGSKVEHEWTEFKYGTVERWTLCLLQGSSNELLWSDAQGVVQGLQRFFDSLYSYPIAFRITDILRGTIGTGFLDSGLPSTISAASASRTNALEAFARPNSFPVLPSHLSVSSLQTWQIPGSELTLEIEAFPAISLLRSDVVAILASARRTVDEKAQANSGTRSRPVRSILVHNPSHASFTMMLASRAPDWGDAQMVMKGLESFSNFIQLSHEFSFEVKDTVRKSLGSGSLSRTSKPLPNSTSTFPTNARMKKRSGCLTHSTLSSNVVNNIYDWPVDGTSFTLNLAPRVNLPISRNDINSVLVLADKTAGKKPFGTGFRGAWREEIDGVAFRLTPVDVIYWDAAIQIIAALEKYFEVFEAYYATIFAIVNGSQEIGDGSVYSRAGPDPFSGQSANKAAISL